MINHAATTNPTKSGVRLLFLLPGSRAPGFPSAPGGHGNRDLGFPSRTFAGGVRLILKIYSRHA